MIKNLNKYWFTKKYPESLNLAWNALSLYERDKEYSPSSVIGGDYLPFIKKYLSESKLARSYVNSNKYQYGSKKNQIVEIANPINNKGGKDLYPLIVFFHGGYWQELSIEESFFPAKNLVNNNIAFAAVVAKKDKKWGETPCAFVEMKPNTSATEEEIISFCRQHLAGFKTPKTVIFQEIPKTSTGKIQKYILRQSLKSSE